MKRLLTLALMGALLTPVVASMAEAGPLQRACMSSDRKAKSRGMCRCLDKVAKGRLSSGEQRLAATFFKDPHKAQEIRQSDNRMHEKFWKKYKVYSGAVSRRCRKYR